MTDEALNQLQEEERMMWAELREAERIRDNLIEAWAKLHRALEQEKAKRKVRAEVLAEMSKEVA